VISDKLLKRLRIAVILVDRNYKIQYFNQKAGDLTGVKLDLYLGKSISEAIKLRNSAGKRLDLQHLIDPMISQTSGALSDEVCRYVHPSGKEFWFSISIIPLEEDTSDIKYFVINIQDITLSREIESNLKESEIRYETLFNSVTDGIFLYEPNEFRLIDVNDRIVEMYGYSKKELKTKWIAELSVKEEGYTNRRGIIQP